MPVTSLHQWLRVLLVLSAFVALGAEGAPSAGTPPGHVTERVCGECHAGVTNAWQASHHASAMQAATRRTVAGDFSAGTVGDGTDSVRLEQQGDAFYAWATDANGQRRSHRILYTLGVSPLQQYLVAAPGGRLQTLTIAWDVRQRRWFSLAEPDAQPGDAMHWSGRYRNWNLMCAECHTTGLRKGYDSATDAYRTRWDALGVGCQACHGPGQAHVDAARRGKKVPMPVLQTTQGHAEGQVDLCARCHTVRSRLVEADRPDRPLLDQFRPEVLRDGLYFPDGQQQGEVFEAGSFKQSRMFAAGVGCTDCHDPHSGKLKREGNATCTMCHSPAGNPRFPTLALKRYDDASHHLHQAGTPGSACVDCHMPTRTYMGVHARRDHAIRIPRLDISSELGTPNACDQCHAGRGKRWAADVLAGRSVPADTRHNAQYDFAGTFLRARKGDVTIAGELTRIVADQTRPALIRATAVDLLGTLGADIPESALRDANPLVRSYAAAAMAAGRGNGKMLIDLLNDPVRAVRMAAARSLLTLGQSIPPDHTLAYAVALDEYKQAQLVMADFPSARLNLALLARDQGAVDTAIEHLQSALRMDNRLEAARLELARLQAALGDTTKAETTLKEGIPLTNKPAELQLALGTLLSKAGRFAEAEQAFAAAVRADPAASRARYSHALVLLRLSRWAEAGTELQALRAEFPDNADVAYALTVLWIQSGQTATARAALPELMRAHPDDQRLRHLWMQVETP